MLYMCKYTPVELFRALGCDMVVPNREAEDLTSTDDMIHSSVCAHARHFLKEARGNGEILLTNCCDSMRRVFDALKAENKASYIGILDLPHSDESCAAALFARELWRIKKEYEEASGHAFDKKVFIDSWKRSAFEWRLKMRTMNDRDFMAVMGARGGEYLHKAIWPKMPYPVMDLTCLGLRNLPDPPEKAEEMADEDLLSLYASCLLKQLPCMRMTDIGSRRMLEEMPHLKAVIYNTIRFCDYYEFEYASLRKRLKLPVLKIETDYTTQTQGQLSTRLEAFAEQIGKKNKEKKMEKKTGVQPLYVGIDSGSTTTNVVVVDDKEEIRAFCVVRTGAKSAVAAEAALNEISTETGVPRDQFAHICATGYGRSYITFADSEKTEITCHARGAHAMNPEARTIIDIGGQDSKVICLREDGSVENFIMNDKCAAGTGRFLEMMARTLELDLKTMDELGLTWKNDLTISSTCTVFAESEVIGLIAENKDTADIIHGLNKAVAQRTCGMVTRSRGTGPYMMTGGGAKNPGLAGEIEKKLGEMLHITEHPDLAGALGAALFARDESFTS